MGPKGFGSFLSTGFHKVWNHSGDFSDYSKSSCVYIITRCAPGISPIEFHPPQKNTRRRYKPPSSEIPRPDLPFPDPRDILLVALEMRLIPTSIPAIPIIIPLPTPTPIRNANIPNLIPDLHPPLTTRRNRADPTKRIISPTGDQKPRKEVQIVNIGRALGDRFADGADETDDVDEDAADVGGVAAPVEAEGEVVGGGFAGGVEVADLIVAAADEVVVADDDAGDGGEEDGVGG